MAIKTKITLTNSISGDELNSFDDMLEDSFDDKIGIDSTSNNEILVDSPSKNEIIDDNLNIFDRKDKICPFADKKLNDYSDVNQKMIEIYEEFVSDTKLTMANLSTMAQNEAYIKARWCSKMIAAKMYTKKLKAEYDELKTKITDMVSSKIKNGAFLTKKASIDSVVHNDSNLKAMWKKIEDASLIEELYKEYYGNIMKNFGFQIRNSIDTLNFERGI